jgi:hypothetical protein
MQGGRTPACLHLQKRRARRANEQPATAHGEQSETASRPLPCLWLPAGRAGHACRCSTRTRTPVSYSLTPPRGQLVRLINPGRLPYP